MPVLSRFTLLLLILLAACTAAPTVNPTPDPTATSLPPTETPTPRPSPTPAPTATPIGEAGVRFVHAAPGMDTITVYAGDTALAANLRPGQATERTTIPAGTYTLRVVPAGSRASAVPSLEQTVVFERNATLLLVLADTGTLNFVPFPDTVPALSADEIGLTLINLLNDVPEVTLSQQGTTLAAAPPVSLSTAVHLPAGTADLELRGSGEMLLPLDNIWPAGIHRTLILVGSRTQPTAVAVDSRAPGRTSLRVVNANANVPAVDVYLDDQPLAANIEYIRPADRIEAVTGTYTARVFTAGANPASDQPLISQTVSLPAVSHTLLLLLESGTSSIVAVYPEDLSPTPPREARITFVNTLERFSTIQLQMGSGTMLTTRYGDIPPATTFSDGSFSFYWVGVERNGQEDTAEIAENVELQAGYAYLYFITGRVDNNPVILSDWVGAASESILSDGDALSNEAAQFRLINALEDETSVEFTADGVSLAVVEYGQGTGFIGLEQRGAEIGVRVAGNELATDSALLESGKRYTVVAYGAASAEVELLIIPDAALVFGGTAPHLRLINTSLDTDVRLGLAYSTARPAIDNLPEGTDEPTIEQYRRSIPVGTLTLVNDIAGRADSGVILLPAGTFNLDILDSDRAQLAVSLASVELQAGAHYDLIAYQETGTPRVRAFILPYPARSD